MSFRTTRIIKALEGKRHRVAMIFIILLTFFNRVQTTNNMPITEYHEFELYLIIASRRRFDCYFCELSCFFLGLFELIHINTIARCDMKIIRLYSKSVMLRWGGGKNLNFSHTQKVVQDDGRVEKTKREYNPNKDVEDKRIR